MRAYINQIDYGNLAGVVIKVVLLFLLPRDLRSRGEDSWHQKEIKKSFYPVIFDSP